ncbi:MULTISPECIES: hypothetical protein [unclassified Nostoc]|uniref:hypothetical protein n=1 Tax=unclassified Nostoc TaxID=2593658 RepID=UPI002AD20D1F|nr:hypothetical protein [Nostoc sp. ChiQUE02]MDZ8230176.1 hypothetical protein [Nostoc sp. ChiQUE02]
MFLNTHIPEEENDQAIALAQDLKYRLHQTSEEEMLLELLVTLIEKSPKVHRIRC